jgi:hypothetical protein
VLIQNNTNWANAGIHLQNNDGSATVNASVFGNSVAAPGASFPFAALFADNGERATDTGTMNLVVGSAVNGAQHNTLASSANAAVDVSLSNFNSSTHFSLSKNGSASGTAAGVIADDNVGAHRASTRPAAAGRSPSSRRFRLRRSDADTACADGACSPSAMRLTPSLTNQKKGPAELASYPYPFPKLWTRYRPKPNAGWHHEHQMRCPRTLRPHHSPRLFLQNRRK